MESAENKRRATGVNRLNQVSKTSANDGCAKKDVAMKEHQMTPLSFDQKLEINH